MGTKWAQSAQKWGTRKYMKNHTPKNMQNMRKCLPKLVSKFIFLHFFASLVPPWDPEVTKTPKYHVFVRKTHICSYIFPFEIAYLFKLSLQCSIFSMLYGRPQCQIIRGAAVARRMASSIKEIMLSRQKRPPKWSKHMFPKNV